MKFVSQFISLEHSLVFLTHLANKLIARSQYGLMVQILSGLITYLLLAIFCHQQYGEKVSIKRVRQLRIQIQKEASYSDNIDPENKDVKEHLKLHAKT